MTKCARLLLARKEPGAFAVTVILLILDVIGTLFIPTLAAKMLNLGTSGSSFTQLWHTGLLMALMSLLSGACAILGGYTCAVLAARIGKDMRMAVYKKSLKLSVYDFRQFGTASITTRTVSDINTIQMAFTSTVQMILPVPAICVIALILCFQLDFRMGMILLGCMLAVLILACGIMYSAASLFKKLQKLLDRMSTVLLENLTGVRVVRAFNNENREYGRMTEAFSEYAETSIKANRRFAKPGRSFLLLYQSVRGDRVLALRKRNQYGKPSDLRYHSGDRIYPDGDVLSDDGADGHPDPAPCAGMLRTYPGSPGSYAGNP